MHALFNRWVSNVFDEAVRINCKRSSPVERLVPVPVVARSPFKVTGVMMTCVRNAQIYGEREPADYFYTVLSGAVQTYRVLVDGRRQISAFYLANETFGIEASDEYGFSAEAIADSKLVAAKRSLIEMLASDDDEIARELRALLSAELRRARAHALLLVKSAPERLASFLLEMSERIQFTDEVELPMSRRDIADHLGLTIETVSRTITRLESLSTIALSGSRRIVVRNRAMLNQLGA